MSSLLLDSSAAGWLASTVSKRRSRRRKIRGDFMAKIRHQQQVPAMYSVCMVSLKGRLYVKVAG
jgi:hypothetical protein